MHCLVKKKKKTLSYFTKVIVMNKFISKYYTSFNEKLLCLAETAKVYIPLLNCTYLVLHFYIIYYFIRYYYIILKNTQHDTVE